MSTSANFPGGRISVEVRIRTDIHPTIVGVPNDARVRVVRRIVVGIGRRETQTYACYERKAKAPPPKPCSDRSGAKAWSDRGGAKGRTDGRATKAGDNGGATKTWADGRHADAAATDGSTSEAAADGSTSEATPNGSTSEAATDSSTPEATAAKSAPAEATTLSKSPVREHRRQ